MFCELDSEFEKVKSKHEKYNDEKNLLHAECNYYSTKVYQYLQDDPTKSLMLFLQALSRLLKRHSLCQYSAYALERMLRTYKSTSIKISGKAENISYVNAEKEFLELLEGNSSMFASCKELTDIGSILCDMFLDNYYIKEATYVKVRTKEHCEHLDWFLDQLKNIETIVTASSLHRASFSKLYHIMYVTKKNQLFYFLAQMFFERQADKKQRLQVSINETIEKLAEYCEASSKACRSYIAAMPKDKQDEPSVKMVLAQHEIDKLTATYYREAYSNKDILKAWKIMDQIKHLFVTKAFKENLQFTENELGYYGEEWTLLYIFAKICLLKEEVSNRIASLGQDWERVVFTEITKSLEGVKDFFKYEISDKKDYTLKIMTSSFAGTFSEYLLRELLQEFYEYVPLNKKSTSDFEKMFSEVQSASSKEDIMLNYIVENGKPDIDIYVKGCCAIFLKNAVVDSEKMKKIWNEVTLCTHHGIATIFYGFNFAKNVQRIEYIRSNFEKMNREFQIHIEPFDIKDLVGVIFEELNRAGHTSSNFQEIDLFRVLDY